MGVYRQLTTGYELAEACLGVLWDQPSLLAFPLLTAVGSLGIIAVALWQWAGRTVQPLDPSTEFLITVAVCYVGASALFRFSKAALAYNAREVIRGRDPKLREGLVAAVRHAPQLLVVSLVAAALTIPLRIFRWGDRHPTDYFRLPVPPSKADVAWAVLTYFAIPVILFEDEPLYRTVPRGVELFAEHWSESGLASFGLWTFAFAATVSSMIPIAIVSVLLGGVFLPIGFGTIGIVTVVGALSASTLVVVAKTALYCFAVDGENPDRFEAVDFVASHLGGHYAVGDEW